MNYLTKFSYLLLFLFLINIISSCKKDDELQGEPPTANAGIDQDAMVGSTVMLNGTATDPDGDELTFNWAITTSPSGSSATISNANNKNASFVPDKVGSYTITFSVSDGIFNTVSDEAIITVTEALGSPPVAVIRDKDGKTINENNDNNSITITQVYVLDGSLSTDPDQDMLTFKWTIVSKPDESNPVINNDTNAESEFVPDIPGEYLIQLEVKDENDNTNATQVTIFAVADPMIINAHINENTILEDIFDSPDMPDYLVTANIDVNAELTIKPGVIIGFQQDRRLKIASSGMINAEGTESNKILLTSANIPGEIKWAGILIESSDVRNSLNNVEISWAGGDEILYSGGWKSTALAVAGNSKLKLNNSKISKSGDYGLFVHEQGELIEFSNNTFESNNGFPVGLYATHASLMDEMSEFTENKKNVVEILKSTITSDSEVTWKKLNNARYFLSGDLLIKALLRINAGAEFELAQNVGITVETEGTLIAKGTASNEILLTSANESGQIHWSGIIFKSSDARNELDYVRVAWAGSKSNFYYIGWNDVSIGIDNNAQLSISNSTISKSKKDGIYIHPNASVSLTDLIFENNQNIPLVLSANQATAINEGFQFTGNGQDVVAIYKSDFTTTDNNTWVALPENAAYYVMDKININSELNINAGALLKFASVAGLYVKNSGALTAEGTAENRIVFTSNSSNEKWLGISIETNNANNKLNYCEISSAGNNNLLYSGGWRKANVALDGTLEIQNSVIKNSNGLGLFISNSSTINGMSSSDSNLETTLLSQITFESNVDLSVLIQ